MFRARMRGGLVNKARRGELRLRLPAGFVYDAQGHIMLDPDQQVQESVRLLFATYLHVDPIDRLVADSLEAEWNAKLATLNAAREDCERRQARDQLLLSQEHRQQLQQLTTAFPKIWNHPNISVRERKRMLGLLIEDVTLIKQREVSIALRFRGGVSTTLRVPRPLLPYESRATRPEVRQLIDELAGEHTDAQIAHVLNERGWTTGSGQHFDGESIRWVRRIARYASLKERLLQAGWRTATQAGAALGIKRHALREMHIRGDIEARICDDRGQWLYWLPSAAPPKGNETPAETTDRSGVRGAV